MVNEPTCTVGRSGTNESEYERPPLFGAQIETLRAALDKLERSERLLDGKHFRPYPVRKRKEALRDLARVAERYEQILHDGEAMSGCQRDAVFLLTPGRAQPYGERVHPQQWQLDRARFIWQHGPRRLRAAVRGELDDMNAIRRLYASEGKRDYDGQIPLAALREPVGDLASLAAFVPGAPNDIHVPTLERPVPCRCAGRGAACAVRGPQRESRGNQ